MTCTRTERQVVTTPCQLFQEHSLNSQTLNPPTFVIHSSPFEGVTVDIKLKTEKSIKLKNDSDDGVGCEVKRKGLRVEIFAYLHGN